MRHLFHALAVLIGFCILFLIGLPAGAQVDRGTIVGTVTDPTGTVIGSITITVTRAPPVSSGSGGGSGSGGSSGSSGSGDGGGTTCTCYCGWPANQVCRTNTDCPPDNSVPGTSVPGVCGCPIGC